MKNLLHVPCFLPGINQCDTLPCLNDGTCVDLELGPELGSASGSGSGSGSGLGFSNEIDAYQCVCRPGFEGRLCETSKGL